MGKKFDDVELFDDQEIHIEHEGKSYIWRGDYEVRTWGELPDWQYPGDSDSEVGKLWTDSFERYIEETDSREAVEFTGDFERLVIESIEL